MFKHMKYKFFSKLLIDGWFKSHPFFIENIYFSIYDYKGIFVNRKGIYELDKQNSGRYSERLFYS